jgi:hypothetical protein
MVKRKKMFAVLALALLLSGSAYSQCAMCRANAESNLKSGKNQIGRGLNTGILYLLSIPYLLGGAAAFIYFKNRSKANQA